MCSRCQETAFHGLRTVKFYGEGPFTFDSMPTILALGPETRIYLLFEIIETNTKYIP